MSGPNKNVTSCSEVAHLHLVCISHSFLQQGVNKFPTTKDQLFVVYASRLV